MAQGPSEVGGSVAPTTDALRSQIEQTRAEISDTIEAIQTRLSPSRVIGDAKDSMTDATVWRLKRVADRTRGAGEHVMHMVRDNPLPVGLLATAAIGLIARTLHAGNRRRQKARWGGADGAGQNRRARNNRTSWHGNRRFLAGASAGAACWAVWQARTARGRVTVAMPETEIHSRVRSL
jgi:hypothetical protein